MVKSKATSARNPIRSPRTIQNLLSSKPSRPRGSTHSSKTVSSTTNALWEWLRRAFVPKVEGLASVYAQQAFTKAHKSFLGALSPPTPAAVAETIIDVATLNSKYA